MIKSGLILLVLFGTFSVTYSQKNVLPKGEILINNGFHRFRGIILSEDSAQFEMRKVPRNNSVYILKSRVKKHLTFDDVKMFHNGKYHYSKGMLFTYSLGFFEDHLQNEFTLSKLMTHKLALGIGSGNNYNVTYFSSSVEDHAIEVNSIPIFIRGQYYLNQGANRFFVVGRVGYAINLDTFRSPSVDNGWQLEAGLGVLFATKHKIRHAISLSQYTLKAKGVAINNSEFARSDINFNVWFNSLAIKYSLIIGR